MATITGLRLSQLDTLTLGSTGTRFLASTASPNSYQMYEKDLYNTLYILHLSGQFQSKDENWRFVELSGEQSITGYKKFINLISGIDIDITNINMSGTSFIDIPNKIIYTSPTKFADMSNRILYDDNDVTGIKFTTLSRYLVDQSGNIALDWNNRILSGGWNIVVNPTIDNQSVVTGNRTVNTTGNQHISGQKDFHGDINFYNQYYASNVLTFRSGIGGYLNLSDNSGVESLNANTREARNTSNQVTIQWGNNKKLLGTTATVDGIYGSTYVNNVDWDNGLISGGWQMTDPDGQVGVHALYRVLVDRNNIAKIDWGNLFGFNAANLRDNAGTIAMYWPIRQTIASDGSTVTLDWNNRRLSGIWRMNNQAIATGDRIMYTSGAQSISGEKTFYGYLRVDNLLGATDGDVAIDLFNHTLQDTTPNAVLDWNNKYLKQGDGAGGAITLDWQNRILSGNWQASNIIISGRRTLTNGEILRDSNETQSIDYGNRLLKNVLGNTCVNWDGHTIYDSDTIQVMNWDDRQLFDNSATITADWQNKVLSGSWTGQSLNVMNDLLSNTLKTFTFILSGTAPSTPTSVGISGQIAMSGQKLFLCTGANKWGYINITPW